MSPRPFIASVAFLLATLLGSLLALPAGLLSRAGEGVVWLGRLWARVILWSAGVRIEVRTHVPIPPGRPYVFMANHLSTIDIWAVLVAVPVSFRFVAKKQLGMIPIFGWAMRSGRFIFIDRQNAASARRSIEEAARRIGAGQSVLIFPEGTRSRDGRLASFKKGGFHLALSSGAAIVPLAIRGSGQLMRPGSPLIRKGVVTVEIDEPIPTTGLGPEDRDGLVQRTRARIAEMLGEEDGISKSLEPA
jgi:1-acyl-sn-glycerol-3-phosphate acyltransferase